MAAGGGSRKGARRTGSRARAVAPNRSNRTGRPAHPRKRTRSVSVTRLVGVPPTRAFDALSRPQDLSKWFTRGARARLVVGGAYANRDGDRGRFLAVERPSVIRMTWENPRHCPGTVVSFRLRRVAARRTSVTVRHLRLTSARDADKMKAAWSWALDSLRSYVETGAPLTVEAWQRERRANVKRAAGRARTGRRKAGGRTKRKAARRR